MADAPGSGDAGAVEAAVTALSGTEKPAYVFALGGLLAQIQPHAVFLNLDVKFQGHHHLQGMAYFQLTIGIGAYHFGAFRR